MSLFRRFTDWLLYTSLFTAVCATGLCMATERLVTGECVPLFSSLHIFLFGATLLVYNVHFIFRKSAPHLSDRHYWTQRFIYWHYFFSVTGFLFCVFSISHLPQCILFWGAVTALLSFAYSLPLLPIRGRRRIREFGWVKILVLTGVWTIVTAVFPILFWHKQISDYPVEIWLRFLFMFTLCIAFDIRDAQTDLESKIYTLPNLIGIRNSYRLMDVVLLLFAVFSVVQYLRYPSAGRLTGEMLTVIVTRLAIMYTRRYPSDRNYLGVIDGMMLVYALLLLLPD